MSSSSPRHQFQRLRRLQKYLHAEAQGCSLLLQRMQTESAPCQFNYWQFRRKALNRVGRRKGLGRYAPFQNERMAPQRGKARPSRRGLVWPGKAGRGSAVKAIEGAASLKAALFAFAPASFQR
jgi:hypothetical protein